MSEKRNSKRAKTDAKLNRQLDMIKKFNKFIKAVVGLDGEEEGPTNEDDLAIQVGFVPGAHIQVFFVLDEEEVWWNAKVIDQTGDTYEVVLDGEEEEESNEEEQVMHLPIYKIRYEARPPEYPKSQVAYVCVADEDKLIDIEAEEGNDMLTWRLRDETPDLNDEVPDAFKPNEDAGKDEEELA